MPDLPAEPLDIAKIDALARSLGVQLPILPRADLYCAGTGVRGPSQMSLEVMSALAHSAKVLGFRDVAWTADVIRALGSRFQELDYPPVARRVDIMRAAATTIAEAVLEEPPVTFLVPGSPVRHVWLTSLLRDWAEREDLSIHFIHGISSTDHICAFLGVEDSAGLQMYDATQLVLFLQKPDPSAHCLVLNLGNTLMQRSAVGSQPLPQMLLPLRDHLLSFYPPDHSVSFVVIGREHKDDWRLDLPLGDLHKRRLPKPLGTLYIPPVRHDRTIRTRTNELSRLVRTAQSPLDSLLARAAYWCLQQVVATDAPHDD